MVPEPRRPRAHDRRELILAGIGAEREALPTADAAGISEDEWLARVMGRPVYNVVLPPGTAPESARRLVMGHRPASRPALYCAKLETDRTDVVRALVTADFTVVDVAVTLTRLPVPSGGPVPRIRVAPAAPGEHAAALEIARTSFRYSRFHLDPDIPNEIADRVKEEWIRSYVRGARGEELLVASVDGDVQGFLAVLVTPDARGRRGIIDLIGVRSGDQRRGVGRALVRAFADAYGPSCHLLQVGTQAANVPSLALYQDEGFRVSATQYVLHAHARPTGPVD